MSVGLQCLIYIVPSNDYCRN